MGLSGEGYNEEDPVIGHCQQLLSKYYCTFMILLLTVKYFCSNNIIDWGLMCNEAMIEALNCLLNLKMLHLDPSAFCRATELCLAGCLPSFLLT